ncbi:MAG: hypothetical protein NT099_01260 [Candidatus Saganbacteria bacterium]|nr:hypothetical protein [Candidatus Saganbacteria bacterium]
MSVIYDASGMGAIKINGEYYQTANKDAGMAQLFFQIFDDLPAGGKVTIGNITFEVQEEKNAAGVTQKKITITVNGTATGTIGAAADLLGQSGETLSDVLFTLAGMSESDSIETKKQIETKIREALVIMNEIQGVTTEDIQKFLTGVSQKKDPVVLAKEIRKARAEQRSAALAQTAAPAAKPEELSTGRTAGDYKAQLDKFLRFTIFKGGEVTTKVSGDSVWITLTDGTEINLTEISEKDLQLLQDKLGIRIPQKLLQLIREGMKLADTGDMVITADDLMKFMATLQWYVDEHPGVETLENAAKIYAKSPTFVRVVEPKVHQEVIDQLTEGVFKDFAAQVDKADPKKPATLELFLNQISNDAIKEALRQYAKKLGIPLDKISSADFAKLLKMLVALADISLLPPTMQKEYFEITSPLKPFIGEFTTKNIIAWVKGKEVTPRSPSFGEVTGIHAGKKPMKTPATDQERMEQSRSILFQMNKPYAYATEDDLHAPVLNSQNPASAARQSRDGNFTDSDADLVLDFDMLVVDTVAMEKNPEEFQMAMGYLDEIIKSSSAKPAFRAAALEWKAQFLFLKAKKAQSSGDAKSRIAVLAELEVTLQQLAKFKTEPIDQTLAGKVGKLEDQLHVEIVNLLMNQYEEACAGITAGSTDFAVLNTKIEELRANISYHLEALEKSDGLVEVAPQFGDKEGVLDADPKTPQQKEVHAKKFAEIQKKKLETHPLLRYAQANLFKETQSGIQLIGDDIAINNFLAVSQTMLEQPIDAEAAYRIMYLRAYVLYQQLQRGGYNADKLDELAKIAEKFLALYNADRRIFSSEANGMFQNVITMMVVTACALKAKATDRGLPKESPAAIEVAKQSKKIDAFWGRIITISEGHPNLSLNLPIHDGQRDPSGNTINIIEPNRGTLVSKKDRWYDYYLLLTKEFGGGKGHDSGAYRRDPVNLLAPELNLF